MDVLEAVFGPTHVADVREAITKVPPSTRRSLPVEEVAAELGKAGIAATDLPYAIEAVQRIVRSHGSEPMPTADFVACTAAVSGLRGMELLMIPNLAHFAVKAFG